MRPKKTIAFTLVLAMVVILYNRAKNEVSTFFKFVEKERDATRVQHQNVRTSDTELVPQQISDLRFYAYTAVVDKRSSTPNFVAVNIQALNGEKDPGLYCCFSAEEDTILQSKLTKRFDFPFAEFKSSVYQCLLPRDKKDIVSVSLARTCNSSGTKVSLRLDQPESPRSLLSVCVHAVYGYIDPEVVVEWMEILWLQGVRRIFIYPLKHFNTVDERTLRVFRFYEATGLVKLIPYELAVNGAELNKERFKTQNAQMFSDEILPIYDCMIRSTEYTYTAVMDFDEIIVPTSGILNLIPTLNSEFERNNKAASFILRVENFISNWTTPTNTSELHFMHYRQRTRAMVDRSKLVHLQGRYLKVYMHTSEPVAGFENVQVSYKTVAVHHYRSCRTGWTDAACLSLYQRFNDTSVLDIKEQLLERLKNVPLSLRRGRRNRTLST